MSLPLKVAYHLPAPEEVGYKLEDQIDWFVRNADQQAADHVQSMQVPGASVALIDHYVNIAPRSGAFGLDYMAASHVVVVSVTPGED